MTHIDPDAVERLGQELGVGRTNAQGLPLAPQVPESGKPPPEAPERPTAPHSGAGEPNARRRVVYRLPDWAKPATTPRILAREYPGADVRIGDATYTAEQLAGAANWEELDG
jgi:hypothetical protein